MVRIVFMGTPEFAVPTLQALQRAFDVVLVVTQPDRQAGRGRALVEPAVKVAAQRLGLPVFQPDTLREPGAVERIRAADPMVIVVAAYGKILRREVLSLPPRGCVNVHASLLPRHRGAAPVAAAILAGDEVTGVTIMLMDEGMDTGPILAQAAEPILPNDTTGTLTQRLAYRGAQLLIETLPRWLAGEVVPQPQDSSLATSAPPINKEDGFINWADPAVTIARQVRAYDPWPGAVTFWQGRRLRIVAAAAITWCGHAEPGTVIALPEGVAVVTGEDALLLRQLQIEGKRCLDWAAFLRGQPGFVGSILESAGECV